MNPVNSSLQFTATYLFIYNLQTPVGPYINLIYQVYILGSLQDRSVDINI